MGYEVIKFNPAEKKFLAKYMPEHKMFTSSAEMMQVINALSLEGKTYHELIAIRNSVVEYYTNRMRLAGKDQDKALDWITAMQSVTSVIDDRKYKHDIV